jgi:hypothetical protein
MPVGQKGGLIFLMKIAFIWVPLLCAVFSMSITTATVKGGDAKEFVRRLKQNHDEFVSLLTTLEQMSPDQQSACVDEVEARADELSLLHSDLVARTTPRMSVLECMFLGLLALCPFLVKLLGMERTPDEDF